MLRVSENLTYDEVIRSDKAKELGIENKPNDLQLLNIKLLANNVFEPLRKLIGKPIHVNSCFRSPLLNSKIKGSATVSQHCAINGAAMDLSATDGYTNKDLFEAAKTLKFDQLIWEFGDDNNPKWVHVSYKLSGNRNMILKSIYDDNGSVKYIVL
jgi:hypothetical protein